MAPGAPALLALCCAALAAGSLSSGSRRDLLVQSPAEAPAAPPAALLAAQEPAPDAGTAESQQRDDFDLATAAGHQEAASLRARQQDPASVLQLPAAGPVPEGHRRDGAVAEQYQVSADYVYPPSCNSLNPPSDSSLWTRWSDPRGWPGGVLPGRGANVTIECGSYMLFDVPSNKDGTPAVVLDVLNITGLLMFEDNPKHPRLGLQANTVVVQGAFVIGSPQQQYRQLADIILGLPDIIAPITRLGGLGPKGIVVVGGIISWHGMPGGGDTPTWARLARAAPINATSLTLDKPVTGWPVGATVVIASTDFDPEQSEEAIITAVSGTTVRLDRRLQYPHFGGSTSTPVKGVTFPQGAEVGLLNRNIRVSGILEPVPRSFFGGHLIIYHTEQQQYIEGTEFSYMGQQGFIGRYPVHFHLCGDVYGSLVRKNSVHHSFQRGYVSHGTHRATFVENFSYRTTGHTYFIEDGVEYGNIFLNNLGIITVEPLTFLPRPEDTEENGLFSDDLPSLFWASNPNNTYIGNAAVGGDSGFWYELLPMVTGPSETRADAQGVAPWTTVFGTFENNTAHSAQKGFTFYRRGYRCPTGATLKNPVMYKNEEVGLEIHASWHVLIQGALVADSHHGVDFNSNLNQTVANSIIMDYTTNAGFANNCTQYGRACIPVSRVCPADFWQNYVSDRPGPAYRTVTGWTRLPVFNHSYGINLASNQAVNVTLSGYDSNCTWGSAVGWENGQGAFEPPDGLLRNITYTGPVSRRVWFDPQHSNDTQMWFVFRDMDGSLTGVGDSWIISDGSPILVPPPTLPNTTCTHRPDWNSWVCNGPPVCYRYFLLTYTEPGNFTYGVVPNVSLSQPLLTRNSDGVSQLEPTTRPVDPGHDFGQDPVTGAVQLYRRFDVQLPANINYTLSIVGANDTSAAALATAQQGFSNIYYMDAFNVPPFGFPWPSCTDQVSISYNGPAFQTSPLNRASPP